MKTSSFYDEISSFYDEMISFETALARRTALLKNFISSDMKYAADLGCGTGLDAISLNKAGLNVTAFDPSDGMLAKAKFNAEKFGADIKFITSPMAEIPQSFSDKFDLAAALGNTLANVPRNEFSSSLKNVSRILKPGGVLVLQILNYERIKKSGERIVNIGLNENMYYIRFYDFLEKDIRFNILKFSSSDPAERQLNSTIIYPYNKQEILDGLDSSGFGKTEAYGTLTKEAFNSDSPDLIVTSIK